MRSKRLTRILAVLLSLQMVFSMAPSMVFAAGSENESSQTDIAVETVSDADFEEEEETAASGDAQNTDTVAGDVDYAEDWSTDDTSEDEDYADVTDEDVQEDESEEGAAVVTDEDEAEPDVITDEDEAEPDADTNGTDASVEVNAVSLTNNIIGDVFANMFNNGKDPEKAAAREASLEEYPLEHHDRSYYGDSIRVRELEGGDAEGCNYLVYRDEYLIISEKDSQNYSVESSEDGLTAFVTPAISEKALKGKHGVVFLGENVGYDNILVFADEPSFEGETMTAALKETENITVNELFSDGKLAVEQKSKKGARGDGVGPVEWETDPSGTNWKGKISNFKASWPTGNCIVDVWELLFEIDLCLKFSLDFDITTTGSSGGLQSVSLAELTVPLKLFSVGLAYKLQVKFDEKPIHVKGKLTTDFDFGLGTHGITMRNYRTQVNVSELTVTNASDYNKDINFYIGSQIAIHGGFLEISFSIYIAKIKIGPVLSLNLDSTGGCYFRARHEKDQLAMPPDTTKDEIHTCSKTGEDGCLSLNRTEVYKHDIYFKIDLYFDSWEKSFADNNKEIYVATTQYYNSYTYNSGMKEGVCPHRLYKVPVSVWMDAEKTQPAPGSKITLHDNVSLDPVAKELAGATADANGKAVLYLPYQQNKKYTLLGSLTSGGVNLIGQAEQPDFIRRGANPNVDIILKSDKQVHVHIDHKWVIDIENKDMPNPNGSEAVWIELQKKEGSSGRWETVERYKVTDVVDYFDYIGDKYANDGLLPKLVEYRAVIAMTNPPDDQTTGYAVWAVPAYTTIASEAEQRHNTGYFVEYNTERDDDDIYTTITETAVMNVTLNKKWALTDEENKAESVYLALQQKPAAGWENVAYEHGIANDWAPVRKPFRGEASSMNDLIGAGILNAAAAPSVEEEPLSIGKVSDENNWSITYMVPKYKKGIKMRFMGSELDGSVIENLLLNEYNVRTVADVEPFGDYTSRSGEAYREYHDMDLTANVLNTDDDEHTISGTVSWVYRKDSTSNPQPDKRDVVIHVLKPDGTEVGTAELRAADNEGSDVWTWSLSGENIDRDGEYTITEEILPGQNQYLNWKPVINDLDAVNYWADGPNPAISIKLIFEGATDTAALPDYVPVSLDFGSEPERLLLSKEESYYFISKPLLKEPLSVEADEVSGWVMEAKAPVISRDGRAVSPNGSIVNYTFVYRKQSDLTLTIGKNWYDNDDESFTHPDSVEVDIFRDDENIGTVTLNDDNNWSIDVTKDKDGNTLQRLSEDGHKYGYVVKEKEIEGFTPQIDILEDSNSAVRAEITNAWVGAENVTVKGDVHWEGDDEHTEFRPDKVKISVINSNKEYVRTIEVPVVDNHYEAKSLPVKDAYGNELSYSVLESHIKGYTTTYSEPQFNDQEKTWTCDITNKLTGYYPVTIKKTIKGEKDGDPEKFKFTIEPKKGPNGASDIPLPAVDGESDKTEIEISGAGEKKAEFLLDKDGLYLYSLKETKGQDENCVYDEKEKALLIVKTTNADGNVEIKSWAGEADSDGETVESMPDKLKTDTVEFVNTYPKKIKIEKKWDIDIENNDKPDSISVIVQKKKKDSDKWETVEVVELKGKGDDEDDSKDWKAEVVVPGLEDKDTEVRVRELKEETALQELANKIKDYVNQGKDKYDDWIKTVKTEGKSYWDALPDDIRQAADEGYDELIDKLNATPENLFKKLMEQFEFASAEKRIVYDKKDKEYESLSDDDKKKRANEPNRVTFHVDEHDSIVSGGSEDAHVTKYKVSYEKNDDGEYTITNLAILDMDVIKRWIGIGTDDEDMPDAAWVVLMFKVNPEAVENAKSLPGVDSSSFSEILDYEFPVFDALDIPFVIEEGGRDPVSIISELALGVDISLFSSILPDMAIDRVTKDDDWTAKFVISKYAMKLPVEFKGAELGSEIIRQIIKYLIQFDIQISYNPFDNFFSIPTKAIQTIAGITDPGDLLDLSKLTGKILDKAKSLTMDDIKNFGPSTLLDAWHMMANVINVKIDWDSDDDDPDSDKITIEGKKTWKYNNETDDNDDNRPESITIRLKADGEDVEDGEKTVTKDDEWKWEFKDLPKKNSDGQEIKYTITEDTVENYTSTVDGYNVTNKYTPGKTQVNVTKKWDDNNNADRIRPDSVTVALFADGEETGKTITLTKSGSWTGSFKDLDEKKDGTKIEYTVKEETDDVITGVDGPGTYSSEVDGSAEKGYTITNKHTSEKVNLSGKKIWDDDNDADGIRPDKIKVYLLADGERVKDDSGNEICAETSKAGAWRYNFSSQPKKNDQGEEIEYTVEEEKTDVITGEDGEGTYAVEVDGLNVTNKHTPEKITIEGKKTWEYDNNDDDNDENRPDSITIRLKANGEEVADKEVTKDDEWKWKFEDQPKKKKGKDIEYTITEDKVENYTTTVDGYNVTNKYTPGKTQVNVEKKWEDDDDQDGIRPNSVTVKLLAKKGDMTEFEDTGKTLTLSEANNWTDSFTDIDVMSDGEAIEYSVTEQTTDVIKGEDDGEDDEDDGPGTYKYKIEGDAENGFTITNTHTPETITIQGDKIWEDNDNEAGKRPEGVTLRLKANGEEVKVINVFEDEEHNWTWKIEDMPKFKDGKEIEYTITEDAVKDYKTEIRGSAEEGFTVTNTYTENKTGVNVTKVWKDDDNRDGIRPKFVTVKLLADGEDTGKTLELTEENKWTGSFDELDITKDDKEIEYTVDEKKDKVINGEDDEKTYSFEITGNANKGFIVTNTHTPRLKSVDVKKVWDDADNQDGIRPKSVIMQLQKRVHDVWITQMSLELNEENKWSGTFTYSADDSDEYQVKERVSPVITGTDVMGQYKDSYSGDIENGYVITNKHTPLKTVQKIEKIWDDDNNNDGKRPDSLDVTLYSKTQDDEADSGSSGPAAVGTVTLNAENQWSAEVDDLPTYKDGKKIAYYWEEQAIDDDRSYALTDTDAGGILTTLTNTHDAENMNRSVGIEWEDFDNNDGWRPEEMQFELHAKTADADLGVAGTVTLKASEGWANGELKDLPVYNDGEKITYTWKPVPDPLYQYSYYTTDNGNHTQFIYWHHPEYIDINIIKKWADAGDQDGLRPDKVTIRLNEVNSESITLCRTIELTAENAVPNRSDEEIWENTIMVFKYKDGKERSFSIEEEPVEGYDTESSELEPIPGVENYYSCTITNTHEPRKIDIAVTKVWEDSAKTTERTIENNDGIRPNSVTVKLLADGEDTGKTRDLSEATEWTGNFADLDARKNGRDIKYTVEEVMTDVITGTDGPGTYAVDISDIEEVQGEENKYSCTITNTHTPETVEKTFMKEWDDEGNNDGKRPDEIDVELHSKVQGDDTEDGVVGTYTISGDNGWKKTVGDLYKYSAGEELSYYWTEEEIDGYAVTKTVVDGDNTTFVNTHDAERQNISLGIEWNDMDDNDRLRPDNMAFDFYVNGEKIDEKTVELSGDDWENVEIKDLPVYQGGKKIEYTWKPVTDPLDGYRYFSYTTGNHTQFVYWHIPDLMAIEVCKVWDDAENEKGIRPESITINLYEEVEGEPRSIRESVQLTADNATDLFSEFDDEVWYYAWILTKKKDGKDVKYSLEEEAVWGYDTEKSELEEVAYETYQCTIKNKVAPMIDIEGSKTWDDQGDKDGKRPDKITIRLLADGEEVDSRTVTREDNWAWSFRDVPKTYAGKEIEYSISEDEVEGYTSTIDGYNVTNVYRSPGPGPGPEPGPNPKPDPDPDEKQYTITYKLNGGQYDGSGEDIIEKHKEGSSISIHAAPVREGYTFRYWKGSRYNPGDKYVVTGDHIFVAQWKKNTDPDDGGDPNDPEDNTPGARTGDDSNILSWLILMLVSLASLLVILNINRKHHFK